ncbi:MAG: tRNA pseudouridine(55) synthase TruB, partial [Acidimicrobiales bacterium]
LGGRRLYDLARDGIEVERAPRPIEVRRFDVQLAGEAGVVRILVECSSGTYVRVLAADLGDRLGGVAHLRALRRLSVGSLSEDEAVALDAVGPLAVRSCLELVRDLPRVEVVTELASALRHGRRVERALVGVAGEGPWAAIDEAGTLVAVLEAHGTDRVHPAVVLPSAN